MKIHFFLNNLRTFEIQYTLFYQVYAFLEQQHQQVPAEQAQVWLNTHSMLITAAGHMFTAVQPPEQLTVQVLSIHMPAAKDAGTAAREVTR